MRHGHGYNKLGMASAHRRAVLRNLATSLLLHERIKTTVPKAKELRRVVDKLITLGKRGDLHARRQVSSYLFDEAAAKKVFSELPARLEKNNGGYTRILKLGPRFGDGAQLATIELVDFTYKAKDSE